MRIGNVYDLIYPYSKGGVEKRNWELAVRLARRGHEVHLFGMRSWDGPDIITKDGVYLHGVCQPQILFTKGRRSVREATYLATKILVSLLREDFDVIDCQNAPYFPCFSAKFHSLLGKSRLLVTWHEVWGNYWYEYMGRPGIFGVWVERLVAHMTDRVIAVSETTKRNLEAIGYKKQVTVIPNGVDLARTRSSNGSQVKSDVIFAGRLIKEKNVVTLLRAISLIARERPDVRCLVVGDGRERRCLEELARDLGIGGNVTFTGFVEADDGVISYMKSSRVFVLPSTREGFGIAALEANACGLPVVTVDHERNAAKDLIKEGYNGYVCQATEESVAQGIRTALSESETLRPQCLDFAEGFDWDNITTKVEESYRSLAASKR